MQASERTFRNLLAAIDLKLTTISAEQVSCGLKVDHLFNYALGKAESELLKSMKGLVVPPQLTKEQRQAIASEWQNNMKLWISDFTKKEIMSLRKKLRESTFAGNRYESAVKMIQSSYGVASNKAKFLARQETGLLMTKFKEVRYKDAGVTKFQWKCVAGTPAHPVRPEHKILDGKVFRWDNPRELDKYGNPNPNGASKPGDNKNPGEDFNCRCTAKPLVEFSGDAQSLRSRR